MKQSYDSGLRFRFDRTSELNSNFGADTLNLNRERFALSVWLSLALLSTEASAQVMNDPMRPPSGYSERDGASDVETAATLVLQSVKITGSDRIAIISGRTVKPGDKVGSATVVRIADSEVVLKEGDTEQTLKLFPDIDKRAADKKPRPDTHNARTTRKPATRSGVASGGGAR